MLAQSGRVEKRLRLAVPVQISSVLDATLTEQTTTENVSSRGIRILTQRAMELKDRRWVKSIDGDLQTLAHVVYCQRLTEGCFGVGLQFQGETVNWLRGSLAGADV